MATTSKTGYLPTLDGWRALAILAVLFDHTAEYTLQQYPRLLAFTHTGPNGVSLFFAISGFLICSRLLEEYRYIGHVSLRGFYIRRACRILPPAMFYLAVIALLAALGLIIVTPAEWWSSVFFVRNYFSPNWITRGWGGYTIHYWSLAVEEQFYLFWPAALVLLGKGRARWLALTLALAVAGWRTWDLHYHWFDRLIPGLLFGSRTDVRLDALLFGCLAALILDADTTRAAFARGFKSWMWLAGVAAYFAVQTVYFVQGVRSYSIFESILLPLMVVGTVYRPQSKVARLLETRPLKWIGRLSYSLYLWQQLFLVPELDSPFSFLQKFPISLTMLVLFAWISYRFVERPFIRWGHKLAPPPTEGREDLVGASPVAMGVN